MTGVPFFFKSDSETRKKSNDYFSEIKIDAHCDVLKTSAYGRFLENFRKEWKIELERAMLPHNTETQLLSDRRSLKPKKIFYSTRVHAATLGHEIRHGW